jgi:hypothetical protein
MLDCAGREKTIGVATSSETSLISAIELQVKSSKSHASAFAVVGKFRSI